MGPDFSVVPSNRRRDYHELKDRKLHLNMSKTFFTLKLTEPWNKLFRQVTESSSMDIFKIHQDPILSNLL